MTDAQRRFGDLATSTQPRMAYALQGGGNQGSFHWGVMDVLLPYMEQNNIPLDVMGGTSAGGMEAVYAAYGWATGRTGQKAASASKWQEKLWVSTDRLATLVRAANSPVGEFLRQSQRFLSGYHMRANEHAHLPMPYYGQHPLVHMIEQHGIDFSRFMKPDAPSVYVNNADVLTGSNDIYWGDALNARAVGGSGTLPELFNAVQVNNSPKWDGGFISNPPVQPAYDLGAAVTDLVIVRITPLAMRPGPVPTMSQDAELKNRQMEMFLNAALETEIRMLKRLADAEGRKFNIHLIAIPPQDLPSLKTKVDFGATNMEFFQHMRALGRKAAETFLNEHAKDIGVRSTYEAAYSVNGARPAPGRLSPKNAA